MGGDVGPEVDPGLGLGEDQAGRGHPVGQLRPLLVAVHDGLVADELLAVPGLLCPGQGDQLVGGRELAEKQLEQSRDRSDVTPIDRSGCTSGQWCLPAWLRRSG